MASHLISLGTPMSKITFQLTKKTKKNKQKNNIKFVKYAYIYQLDEQIER